MQRSGPPPASVAGSGDQAARPTFWPISKSTALESWRPTGGGACGRHSSEAHI